MTFDEFEKAIAQTPSDLTACHEESGNYFADIECEGELFCIVYAGGNWTLSRDEIASPLQQSTQTIAIDESDLPNLKAKIQELKEGNR